MDYSSHMPLLFSDIVTMYARACVHVYVRIFSLFLNKNLSTTKNTRMHSSRMRTGRAWPYPGGRGGCLPGGGACQGGAGGCLPGGGACRGGCLPGGGACRGGTWPAPPPENLEQAPPPCGQNDTRLWKYYLGQNFVSAGKNYGFFKKESTEKEHAYFKGPYKYVPHSM